ncbi:MAG: shikimate kinase [Nitriliruptoraceae bacterium]
MMSRNICLAGMMGSGKTTIAALLADKLGRRSVDTDEEIVTWTGHNVPDLFGMHGEAGFRDLEHQVISELAKYHDLVIALGGGAVLRVDNLDALRLTSVVVLLDVPLEVLVERLAGETSSRPLLAPRPSAGRASADVVDDGADATWSQRLAITYGERAERYRHAADNVIDGAGEPHEVVDTIVAWAVEQGDILTPSEHEQVMT